MTMWDNPGWNPPDQMRGLAEISGFNALISDEEKKINNVYYQIGKLYATIHRSDSEGEFAGLVESVAESERKIEEYRTRILHIRGLVRCPGCGMELPKSAAFCMSCGIPMPKVEEAPAQDEFVQCSACGTMVLKEMRFCGNCGRPMTAPVQEEAAPEQVDAETRDESVEVPAAEVFGEEAPVKLACGNCGAVLEQDALFCANCGASVKDNAVPAPEEEPQEYDIWARTMEAGELDPFEETAEEAPEEPVGFTGGASPLLMAVPDLEEDDTWDAPMEAPVVEIFPEEFSVEIPVKLACGNCGAALENDALFCTECGASVKSAAAPAPEENDIWDEPLEAPALYIVEEERPPEIPEKPACSTVDLSSLLVAVPDLDEVEAWGEPKEAPAAEVFTEVFPAKRECANCGAALENDALFCTECGTPVKAATAPGKRFCTTCGAELEEGMLFCTECGTRV